MTPQEILLKAADILTPRGAWTQHVFAADKKGRTVSVKSPKATCFCLVGAVSKATGDNPEETAKALALIDIPSIYLWNDAPSRRKAQVIARLRKAAQ